MDYEVIVLPNMDTIRKTTVEYLERFLDAGKEIISLGSYPKYVDARKSEEAKFMFRKTTNIEIEENELIQSLKLYKDIDIRLSNGEKSDDLIYQFREDVDCDYVFIASGKRRKIYFWNI